VSRTVIPGNTKGFNNSNLEIKTAAATCNFGTTFYVNSVSYKFSNFAFKSYAFHFARTSAIHVTKTQKSHTEIGFEVESDFYKLLDVCFDDVLYTTLYVKATIVFGIPGYQKGFPRPSFIEDSLHPWMSVNTLYTRITQRETISDLLGSNHLGDQYIDGTTVFFSGQRPLFSQS